MLLLLFKIEKNGYAMDTSHIQEIIPFLITEEIIDAPSYVAGTINLRGQHLPVIDLGVLLKNVPCRQLLSTRIVIFNSPRFPRNRSIGLMAENITGTVKTPPNWQPTLKSNGTFMVERNIVGPRDVEWFNPEQVITENILKHIGL